MSHMTDPIIDSFFNRSTCARNQFFPFHEKMSTICAGATAHLSPTFLTCDRNAASMAPFDTATHTMLHVKGGDNMTDTILKDKELNAESPSEESLMKTQGYETDALSSEEFALANRLIALRKERSLSQDDLARDLKISRQAISRWERGTSAPDTVNLISLAKIYNISLDELAGLKHPSIEPKESPHQMDSLQGKSSIHGRLNKLRPALLAIAAFVIIAAGFGIYYLFQQSSGTSFDYGTVVAMDDKAREIVIRVSDDVRSVDDPLYCTIKMQPKTAVLNEQGNWDAELKPKVGDRIQIAYQGAYQADIRFIDNPISIQITNH